jgi:hypothetical protein
VLKKSVDESPPKKNNINLDNFKKECEDLGFKPKTEKFGECVLRLVESSKR